MDEILNNVRLRNLFFVCAVGLAAVLAGLRYAVLPRLNPNLPGGATVTVAQFCDSLLTSLIATIAIGSFIFFVTPKVMRVAKIEPVDPKDINRLLREAALKSTRWTFKGGMGRYTRYETLPTLLRMGRDSGIPRRITLMLINPDESQACRSYASYREGLASATKGQQLTADTVRNQVLATIVAASRATVNESMVDIEIFLLNAWSVMRVDLSDQYVLVTGEDSREPGLRADSGTHFYKTYSKDLEFIARQARRLPKLELNISLEAPDDVPQLLRALDISSEGLDPERMKEIWDLALKGTHQYD